MKKKEMTERQGRMVAEFYLGKVQRGKMTEDECVEEIRRKLGKEGYDTGAILWTISEFTDLVREHGDYKW